MIDPNYHLAQQKLAQASGQALERAKRVLKLVSSSPPPPNLKEGDNQ